MAATGLGLDSFPVAGRAHRRPAGDRARAGGTQKCRAALCPLRAGPGRHAPLFSGHLWGAGSCIRRGFPPASFDRRGRHLPDFFPARQTASGAACDSSRADGISLDRSGISRLEPLHAGNRRRLAVGCESPERAKGGRALCGLAPAAAGDFRPGRGPVRIVPAGLRQDRHRSPARLPEDFGAWCGRR